MGSICSYCQDKWTIEEYSVYNVFNFLCKICSVSNLTRRVKRFFFLMISNPSQDDNVGKKFTRLFPLFTGKSRQRVKGCWRTLQGKENYFETLT